MNSPPPSPAHSPGGPSLRQRVVKGGLFLLARQGAGAVIRLVALVIVAGILGPDRFGVYAGPAALMTVFFAFLPLGLPTFLLRAPDDPDATSWDTTIWFLGAMGLAAFLLSVSTRPLLEGLIDDHRLFGPTQVMLIAVTIQLVGTPARAVLSRDLDFARLGAVEVAGDVAFLVTSVGLALAGAGYWAPVLGQLTFASVVSLSAMAVTKLWPGRHFSLRRLRELLPQSIGFAGSGGLVHVFDFTTLALVGAIGGTEALGVVSLGQRVTFRAAIVRQAIVNMALVSMAKVQTEIDRLRSAHSDASVIQLLGSGPIFAGLAVVGAVAFVPLLGDEWEPAVGLLPMLCAYQLVNLPYDAHRSVLQVLNLNRPVIWQRLAELALYCGSGVFLIDRYGVDGYGYALLVGCLSFLVLDRAVRRLFHPRWARVAPWLAAFLPFCLAPVLPVVAIPVLALPALIVIATPRWRAELISLGREIRGAVAG